MDRIIKKNNWPVGRTLVITVAVAAVLLLGWMVYDQSGTTRLRIDPTRMTISQVKYGEFQEYYPSSGWVEPEVSYQLSVEQGGRVHEIIAEDGQFINKGDMILRLSNASLQRSNITTETQLLENLDIQRNTQFTRTTQQIMMRQSLLDLEYQILELEKKFTRYSKLVEEENVSAITREQYEAVRDELEYRRNSRDLLKERIRIEEHLSKQQLELADQSIDRLNKSLDLLNQIKESMDVRAPITGHLSSIDAEIGENINPGQRIGQIDLLDRFKVRVEIDQYYLSRVNIGTSGKFNLDGQSYGVTVKKIYPEVTDNYFEVDMSFTSEPPPNLRRGQELTVELSFSEPTQSLMVSKGGFYQQTSGRWVYLVSEDGTSARRANIRLGRQNPRSVEVLEGLNEGDYIITSGYDTFNEVDELEFNEPLQLTP